MFLPIALILVVCCFYNVHTATVVEIKGTQFYVNGNVTFKGSEAEGLLPNARLIQGVFDDENPATRNNWKYPDTGVWDPERNTQEFVGNMSSWKDQGLLAFTVGLQGGSPHCYGNFGWNVSAFYHNGTMKQAWKDRLLQILTKADEIGMVPIVQYFYYYQYSSINSDKQNVAVQSATEFLLQTGYKNFIIDAFNERCGAEDAPRISLIKNISKAQGRKLLVSTSCGGRGTPDPAVMEVADFVLMHGNGNSLQDFESKINAVKAMPEYKSNPVPIMFNEDDSGKFTTTDPNGSHLNIATTNNASWGFLCCCDGNVQGDYSTGYQCPPVDWRIGSGQGKCLSGPKGNLLPNASKVDFGMALKRITKDDL
eukprot:m.12660 g.12660  ORF g.12660 m.12660 type:complete len:367 (+) comp4705_c0_seq1:119-1219(+)